MNEDRPIFDLIGDRYLDYQFDEEYIRDLESELRSRGIVGIKRCLLEYIAASSLWWNVIWWDWNSLNAWDIKLGWLLNLELFGLLSLLIGIVIGIDAGMVCFLFLHLCTTGLGLLLRAGTRKT